MVQFLKFGAVGILNTLITIGTYSVLVYFNLNYITANVIGYALGVLNSYYWNKNWVFGTNQTQKSMFIKFVLVNLITLGFNTLILYLLVQHAGLNLFLSQLIATGIGLLFNYILNKKWTFNFKIV
jgi:putative flippase GtrA